MTPKALVRPLSDFSGFKVWVTLYGMENPAGPRLERLKPLPDPQYRYFKTEDEAQAAADRLQGYLDEHHRPPGKRRRKRRR